MAEEDDASKTEDPSDKKLADAKKKGQVVQSQEIKSWAILMGGLGLLIIVGPFIARDLRGVIRPFIEMPDSISPDFEHLRFVLSNLLTDVGWIMAPVLACLFLIAIAANVGQFGLFLATEKIKPDWSKLSLLKGVKRLVSFKAIMEFLKGILKLIAVGVISMFLAIPLLQDIEVIPQMDIIYSIDRIYVVAITLFAGTVAAMTVIAFADYVFQRHSFMKDMRMSKQEVKDEYKQQEGDPQIKARIRKLRMERAQQRMMAAVPDADVVVTNPTHYSVALTYKMDEMAAPKLVAKGVDHMAFRIREIAEANDVPLVENPPLARALYAGVELDEEIPAEHFQAVAEVIGFVMRKRGLLSS